MPPSVSRPYLYIAFDENSGALLAHGCTAVEALSYADMAAPAAPIKIVRAGDFGATIWANKLSFEFARSVATLLTAPVCLQDLPPHIQSQHEGKANILEPKKWLLRFRKIVDKIQYIKG